MAEYTALSKGYVGGRMIAEGSTFEHDFTEIVRNEKGEIQTGPDGKAKTKKGSPPKWVEPVAAPAKTQSTAKAD